MKASNRNRSKATRGRRASRSSAVSNSLQRRRQKRAPSLEDAIELALKVHRGMTDKAGAPYILHVLRVMLAVEGETARLAAVLHDVIEDSDYTLADLRDLGFPDEVVDTVDALSRRPGEPYDAFIRRASAHPTARLIKLADLEDNLDLRRLARFDESDWHRLQRYRQAWQVLKNGGA
jgi:(p)ppGpp synthase/HD superfamily hydrolase